MVCRECGEKMNEQPKISIITACYNSEKTIEQTIQSVLEQTYKNIEYIIIDGASTDETLAIVDKYKNRIDVVVSERDNGVYDAFNKGVHTASGEYILFLNSDDYFFDKRVLEQLASFLEEKNKPVCIYGDIYIKNEITGYIFRWNPVFSLDKIKAGLMPSHQAILLSKNIITEFDGFDLQYRIAADFDLMIKVFMKYSNKMFHIPLIVSVFRLGGLSSDFNTVPIVKMEKNQIIEKYFSNKDSYLKSLVNRTNEDYLIKWIENLIFQKKSISDSLIKRGIKKVVIFGSGEMAVLISRDLILNGIQVVGYLDNNIDRQGLVMSNVSIFSPDWLKVNAELVDAIIYGFQGFHEDEVEKQIDSFKIDSELKRISWRELI